MSDRIQLSRRAILTGAAAVAGLSWGCSLMVRETRLAIHNLAEEAQITGTHK